MEKSHNDYIDIIGTTCATGRNRAEICWNKYYFISYVRAVNSLLSGVETQGRSVLDVGTSHGNWYSFLKSKGFKEIYGVELYKERALQAQACGYTKMYNCDAASIPHPSESIDVAMSNDVFVHILRMQDKEAILKEILRVLKPGGTLIFNHTMSSAQLYTGYTIAGHCSYLSLDEFIGLVRDKAGFSILDLKPTYYHHRAGIKCKINSLMRRLITFPFIPGLMQVADAMNANHLPLEMSETVYIKAKKTFDQDIVRKNDH